MKYIHLFLIFVCANIFCCSNKSLDEEFLGIWVKGTTDTITELYLLEKNKFSITVVSHSINNTFKYDGNYFINHGKTPSTIDLRNISGFDGPLYGIVKIMDANQIVLSKLSRKLKLRPISFDRLNSLVFDRKKIKGDSLWNR